VKVIRADVLGVCMGVRRALTIVEETLAGNPGTPIHTLGPLIHNPRTVEDLRRRGVVPVDRLDEVRGGIVVIRAHGVGPETLREIAARGLRVVDATCSHVLRVQRIVAEHAAKGYFALIAGDAGHGEVKGIRAYAGRSAVVSTAAEARAVDLSSPALVVSQTTFRRQDYREIVAVLKEREPTIAVFDTSCALTETRQDSLRRLADRVDALLVIGGRESANTRWLHQTALQTGKPAWHIEGAGEIPAEIARYASVGISAGASTPDAIIAEVERALATL
jgi:4-hydroxy-3-methylbut-2-en-1-yl diphosphate reductase